MKRRYGFVSNSSSSSFVVLLPEGLTLDDQDIQSAINADGSCVEVVHVRGAFAALQEKGSVWDFDYMHEIGVLRQLLEDYIIASVEVGSDGGGIVSVEKDGIEKIKKILD